jgi:hypothetical protein
LQEFYEAERKRLLVEFDEVLEKKIGKLHEVVEKKQTPNFVINGTKLVFINNEDRSPPPQQ